MAAPADHAGRPHITFCNVTLAINKSLLALLSDAEDPFSGNTQAKPNTLFERSVPIMWKEWEQGCLKKKMP